MARRSPVQSVHVSPNRAAAEPPVTSPSEEPAWKQRAVERSIKTAKLRAAQRVQRFLDAAQAIIIEKGSTDFTVQEVVDRSRQSLRSFYLQFDGKHELLLALFEDALSRSADQIRAATASQDDPLERLKVAIQLLFESSRPDPSAKRPLFTDFAPRLLVSHPSEVKVAHAPLLALLTELMEEASDAGQLRAGINPRRMAAMTMQTVMFVAQSSSDVGEGAAHPITAAEVWDFCAHGFSAE
ncbi:TetR/AcrR family transcriptional regulator [Mycobacterium sp. Y57]|uniref:TetR/AcrR family transcriptional regulator n=1 Tax=Mycolicibacterium xanthum TaxID=2796469 RepID=UPI001C85E811|nr:TetR/AcrR family transcriptional regulator [Mycolicibacterium xanthum]MBX7433298.1 TetR/AcrR family transcriptional regulator [Mycolicibacterium xanthum]